MTAQIAKLSTPELQLGDVVLEYGMRVRLDTEPQVFHRDGEVYVWKGTVENLDEVLAAGIVPRSFLCEDRWEDGKGWVCELTGRWAVQGNELAIWDVERAAG